MKEVQFALPEAYFVLYIIRDWLTNGNTVLLV